MEGRSATAWLDAFFTSYYRRRPVSATFIGVHDFDSLLPDLSESGAGETLAEMEALLRSAPDPDEPELSPVERADLRLARGFLQIESWEHRSRHFQRGNPSLYTGEAVFGVMSLFLSDYAPLASRMEAAIQRLEAVPRLLAHGRANVPSAPPRWTERALRECTGALVFLGEGIDKLAAAEPTLRAGLRRAADVARQAFSEHDVHLRTAHGDSSSEQAACGPEALSLHLREGHFLEMDADEVADYARGELDEASAWLEANAPDHGETDPLGVLAQLPDSRPREDGYYGRYQEIWDEVRGICQERDLVTWPEHPIRYVPRPAWVRKAAPFLYFLFYRSPAAFGAPPVHDYLVTPLDPDLPAPERQALLASHNDAVIKLNHVVHHGGIGHHVQNAHALRWSHFVGQSEGDLKVDSDGLQSPRGSA